MKKIISVQFFLISFLSIAIAGGPWPQQQGKGYIKLAEWWVVFNQHFTATNEIELNTKTGIFNTSIYAEYGFTNRLTGIVNAPLFSHNYIDAVISPINQQVLREREAIHAFGDIDLGVKYGLSKSGKIPMSVSLILGLPTGASSAGSSGDLQTGDGEFNQMVQFDIGTGFKLGKKKRVSSYVTAYLGFNNRTKNYSEEIRYGFEYGAGLIKDKLWLVAKINAVESLKNGSAETTNQSISLFANNTEYIGFTVEASYYFTPKLGISANYGGAFRGELIAANPSYSVGVFYDFSQ